MAARRDSCGHEAREGSLDASGHSPDAREGGGALDALWRFEAAHHVLLNRELANSYAPFVDALYAALEDARDALERQSVRVLAVLHDKDARIRELEEETRETQDVATQTTRRARSQETQCAAVGGSAGEIALQRKVSEQEEQIDVLLDELERIQKVLGESEAARMADQEKVVERSVSTSSATQTDASVSTDSRLVQEIAKKPISQSSTTQTDELVSVGNETQDAEATLSAIAALQMQLEAAERANAELFAELRQKQERDKGDFDLDAVEKQLSDAVQVMETSSQCRLNPLAVQEYKTPCLDLEHRLEATESERDQLIDELLAIRAALGQESSPQDRVGKVVENAPGPAAIKKCRQITCHHTLRRILRQVRAKGQKECLTKAKTLRKELRIALRSGTQEECTSLIPSVTAGWMQWEAAHVQELETMHRERLEHARIQATRAEHLVDEVHRLSQANTALQTQIKIMASEAQQIADTQTCGIESIETDRRVLALEQELLLRKEQLDIANRAVVALSSANDFKQREVRFADGECTTNEPQTASSSTKLHIAELNGELQRLRESDFKRFLPSSTSQHAVVEYFRLEKECLRLKCRLNEKEEEIEQLKLQYQQLEQASASLRTKSQSCAVFESVQRLVQLDVDEVDASRGSADRYYQRYLESQNEDLWLELEKAHSRIMYLDQQREEKQDKHNSSDAGKDSTQSSTMDQLVNKLNEYHAQAREAFQTWERTIRGSSTATKDVHADGGRTQGILISYGILLDHYESLSIQLQLLQDAASWPSPSTSNESPSETSSRHLRLLAKIRTLEARLLESQSCRACGDVVPKPKLIQMKDTSTITLSGSTADSSTQISSRDRRRAQHSKRVQADLGIVVLHVERSPESQPIDESKPSPTAEDATSMASGADSALPLRQLNKIQQQLEASLVRIHELTSQKEELNRQLDEARTQNRKDTKEQESLRKQVEEVLSSNAALSSQLSHCHSAGNRSQEVRDLQLELDRANQMLALKENENGELARELCEVKERCTQLQKSRDKVKQEVGRLQATLESQQASRLQEQNKQLDEYMTKVNQSLASIERDKERLCHENRDLQHKLQQIEREAALKEARGTRTCATETDEYVELVRLQQLPEYQSLETQLVMLQNELEAERRASEKLRASRDQEQKERDKAFESERTALEVEKAELRQLVEEVKVSHEALQQEFVELQAASEDEKQEADKRIAFLVACVEESSRLVDVTGPTDEVLTARDIYDTIVAVSNRVVSASAVPSSTMETKKLLTPKTRHARDKKVDEAQETAVGSSLEVGNLGVQVHSQLQAETWRVRAVKLELSLRATNLKNKSFEEMMAHLEVQMQGLKAEVKERMSKESVLLAKQGQMKVEITNLKSQNATLTSRLAEACGDLKRCQDAFKTNDGEVARLRSALQRKTELLVRQKAKCGEYQKALDQSLVRVAELEIIEKSFAVTQLKQRDQVVQVQELRQQWTVCRDANSELRAEVDKRAEQIGELQSRVKALRLDNGRLRDQLKELKSALKETAETAFKTKISDAAVAAAVLGDGRNPATVNATAAVDMLAAQVKTLKRRVLQKQDVIRAYKTKVSELDTELTLQRTKLFDLSQAHRQLQQVQREKENSLLQGVTHLKQELESSVATKAEQLDGLRASLFDALEVFVQCDAPSPPSASPLSSPHSSLSWVDRTDEIDEDSGADALLQELRRYADLSPDDLANLHIMSPTSETKCHRQRNESDLRLDRDHRQQLRRKRGQRVLLDLEHALEVAPQDCRTEICQVLEFLCRQRGLARAAR